MSPLLYLRIAVAVGLFAAGAYSHHRWTEAKAAKAALQASEQARKVERDNAVSLIRKMDSYSVTAVENQRRALVARSDLERVRNSAAVLAASAPAAACGPDPRLAGVLELLAEGAGLVEEGSRHVDDLRAKRDALK
jgi:hypothetical protein